MFLLNSSEFIERISPFETSELLGLGRLSRLSISHKIGSDFRFPKPAKSSQPPIYEDAREEPLSSHCHHSAQHYPTHTHTHKSTTEITHTHWNKGYRENPHPQNYEKHWQINIHVIEPDAKTSLSTDKQRLLSAISQLSQQNPSTIAQ